MYKYRSKCRWNMLLHIDGEVIEIRPGELFESKTLVDSRYLNVIEQDKDEPKKKKGRPKTITNETVDESYGSSGTES